jgi:hypothetical protein
LGQECPAAHKKEIARRGVRHAGRRFEEAFALGPVEGTDINRLAFLPGGPSEEEKMPAVGKEDGPAVTYLTE